MSQLWTPPGSRAPKVSNDLVNSTKDHNEHVDALASKDEVCREFDRELRRIDSNIDMVWFGERTPVGGAPHRYHLRIRPPVGPKTLVAITGPRGEFVVPGSAIYAKLAEGDLWNGEAERHRKRSAHEAEKAAERARRREAEDRQEELKDRWNAATRTSVSMLPGWTQNSAGQRRVKR